jgi:hypothetical protein
MGKRRRSVPAKDSNVAPQVLDLVIELPILVLNALVVGQHSLAGKNLLLIVLARDFQAHVVTFHTFVFVKNKLILLPLTLDLQYS